MNWSRREMSAESVASTNEPSISGSGAMPISLTSATPITKNDHQPQSSLSSSSLPAYLTARTLMASSLAATSNLIMGTGQVTHATTINPLPLPLPLPFSSAPPLASTPIQPAHASAVSGDTAAIQQPLSLAMMMAQPAISSPDAAIEQEQSSSEWWDDYWSRQPFPSGYTQSSITLLACFISTIIFLIVVGNLLVCIAIFTEKSLKPTQNWFIASLAVSDMLLGLVVMPFSLARELMGFWVFGPLWCDIHEAVDVLLSTASINTLCLISLDRYWSITQAVSYLKKRTPKRCAFMIAFVWVFSAAVSLPPLFGWKKQQTPIVVSGAKQPQVNATSSNGDTNKPKQISDSIGADDRFIINNLDYVNEALISTESAPFEEKTYEEQRLRRRRRQRPTISELATPVSIADRRSDTFGEPLSLTRDSPTTMEPSPTTTKTDQQQAILGDYPTCQLSDDLGYVLYSALGSFYIPCAVMVFTYIKIFMAARSRARRAISKQARGAGANKRPGATTNRRTIAAAGSDAATKQQLAVQQGCNASTISGQVTSYAGSLSHNGSSSNDQDNHHHHHHPHERTKTVDEAANGSSSVIMKASAPMMKGGKIVIVERKKSLAAIAAQSYNGQQRANSIDDSLAAIQAANQASHKPSSAQGAQMVAETNGLSAGKEDKESARCTLTTSGAKQASPSTLNSSASNDSSMITVMHDSMVEVPQVTRFNFRDPNELPSTRIGQAATKRSPASDDNGARKAAALLETIRQVSANEQHLVSEVLAGSDSDESIKMVAAVPNIVVERRETGQQVSNEAQNGDRESATMATGEQVNCCDGLNATSETCFMTIEEDSDMFESQTGRTITMVASNASQRQTNNLARNQSTIVTMMPVLQHSTMVCSDVTCRSAQRPATAVAPSARSASSYCGSSMTMNDDEIDDCDGDDDDEDDEDNVDVDGDDEEDEGEGEPLTDECNGFSCSIGYDHYCPEQDLSSTCIQCQECEQAERQAAINSDALQRSISEGLSPIHCPQQQVKHHHHHHQQQQRRHRQIQQQDADTTEVQSITGDDNMSLTEYRSNEDEDDSSIIGHDVLDATDSRRRNESKKVQSISGPSAAGERKKSSIGFRLARLGSTAPLSNYSGGLMALASSAQQQSGGTRNLKALRQNFFLKLNQLTAKSVNKQQDSKSKKCTSPTGGKSSAQSSGTSYEPSVDYATTSNIHSNEYPQETTMGNESEQHSSSEQAAMLAKQSNEGHNKSKDLINGPQNEGKSLPTSDRLTTGQPEGGEMKFARQGDKTVLLEGVQPETGDLGAGSDRHNINKMVGRISSGLVSSSKSAAAVGAGAGLVKSQRFDLEDHHPHHHHGSSAKTAGGTAGGKKRPTIGGYSSTMMSSSAGSGQPTSQRAYLASDNERHKRKLAKARERRATLILGLIMAAFICSWLPFFTFYVLRAICSSCKDNVSPRFEAFIFWMGYCNSAINPIIYTIFNRDFRRAFRKILFKCL